MHRLCNRRAQRSERSGATPPHSTARTDGPPVTCTGCVWVAHEAQALVIAAAELTGGAIVAGDALERCDNVAKRVRHAFEVAGACTLVAARVDGRRVRDAALRTAGNGASHVDVQSLVVAPQDMT